jgi:hypothetical protein
MGVTAASVVWNYTQRQIHPLQRRVHFAFDYQGTEDVDRLSAEPIDREVGLRVISSIFPDQLKVPYVPTVFKASNPPAEVKFLSCPTAFCRVDYYFCLLTCYSWVCSS